jgi:NADPH-dependent 7-cyano-7-deazaguanine reductase QueF
MAVFAREYQEGEYQGREVEACRRVDSVTMMAPLMNVLCLFSNQPSM